MLRLLSSKEQEPNYFLENYLSPVMLVFIG